MPESVLLRVDLMPGLPRTLTAVDGPCPPRPGVWNTSDNGSVWIHNGEKPYARFRTDLDIAGTLTTLNDPVLTFRRYLRAIDNVSKVYTYKVDEEGLTWSYTRRRITGATAGIKCVKLASAAYTDYSANVVGVTSYADLSSLPTVATGYWMLGLPQQFNGFDVMGLPAANGGAAATMGVFYYNGTAWTTVGATLADGSLTGGKTLAQVGQVTWQRAAAWAPGAPTADAAGIVTATSMTAAQVAQYYWVRVSNSATLGTVHVSNIGMILPVQWSPATMKVQGLPASMQLEAVSNGAGITDSGTITVNGTISTQYM